MFNKKVWVANTENENPQDYHLRIILVIEWVSIISHFAVFTFKISYIGNNLYCYNLSGFIT